jgi:hypothetical protein
MTYLNINSFCIPEFFIFLPIYHSKTAKTGNFENVIGVYNDFCIYDFFISFYIKEAGFFYINVQ